MAGHHKWKTIRHKSEVQGRQTITVSAFGVGALDAPDATLSPEECEALAAAWLRTASAVRSCEYGKITVIDDEGDEIMEVGIDYENIPFDMKNGFPLIQEFRSKR